MSTLGRTLSRGFSPARTKSHHFSGMEISGIVALAVCLIVGVVVFADVKRYIKMMLM